MNKLKQVISLVLLGGTLSLTACIVDPGRGGDHGGARDGQRSRQPGGHRDDDHDRRCDPGNEHRDRDCRDEH
jgi:hypothetical protein